MLYFSGTGNTRFAVQTFAQHFNHVEHFSIEEDIDYQHKIHEAEEITIAYPIYTSQMPKNMEAFLLKYKEYFLDKTVHVLVTQLFFSGDGAMLAIRLLGKKRVKVGQLMHLSMPNNISDVSFLKVVDDNRLKMILDQKALKIKRMADRINQGKKYRHGSRFYSRVLGYLFQRIFEPKFFYKFRQRLTVDENCILCQKCVNHCPVENLYQEEGLILSSHQCILCYRCVNICPTKSISIIGKKGPIKQYMNDNLVK